MKTTRPFLIAAILLPLLATSPAIAAVASPDLSSMVSNWRTQRDAAVRDLAVLWLREKEPERRQRLLQRVVTLDLRLATQPGELLITDIEGIPENIEDAERRVVLAWLEREGWNKDSGRFFRDRTFHLVEE